MGSRRAPSTGGEARQRRTRFRTRHEQTHFARAWGLTRLFEFTLSGLNSPALPTVDTSALLWIVAIVLIIVGVAGTILPALPGTILVLAGIVLGAWIDSFARVPGWVVALIALLAVLAWATDYLATVLGARRAGASTLAIVGAATLLTVTEVTAEAVALPSLTVTVTVYVPLSGKLCDGVAPLPVVPSPKSHA